MRTLLAAVAVLGLGCGPEEVEPQVAQRTDAVEAMDPQPDTTLRLVVEQTDQGLMFKLVNDPVEERFFHAANVIQPAPQVPTPPCPNCRW